jgi:prepilin-type N-terminal cleavage/methylation domain-containing protein
VLNVRRSSGFTLAELLVATAMLGMLGAAALTVMLGQMRFHAAAVREMESRRAVHGGADLLRADLRGLAPTAGGIYALLPNSIDVRAPMGASVICHIDGSRTMVGVPPVYAAAGALTSWSPQPQRGDTVLVFVENDPTSGPSTPDDGISAPGAWSVHVLTADPASGGTCPTASGLTRSSAEAAAAVSLRLAPPLAPEVSPGAALRFVRRARYQLYRASDGYWYLGYADCLASRATPCATIQPVNGPFAPGGIRFAFWDSTGALTSDPTRVARIDVLARALGDRAGKAGAAREPAAESLLITIAPRNR